MTRGVVPHGASARGPLARLARPASAAVAPAASGSASASTPLFALLLGALALALVADGTGVGAHRAWLLLAIAPIVEELVFRTGLQESLLRRGLTARASAAWTAIAFAAAHAAFRGDPAAAVVVVPALAIGALYARGRSVAACIVLHAAMNACWIGAFG